jgi:hypothetical protein
MKQFKWLFCVLATCLFMLFVGCSDGGSGVSGGGSNDNNPNDNNPNVGSNPIAGTWLSEDAGLFIFISEGTEPATMHVIEINWSRSSSRCVVTAEWGSYKVDFGGKSTTTYELGDDGRTLVGDEIEYTKMGGPTQVSSRVPFAGTWIQNPGSLTGGRQGLLVGIPDGSISTILAGTARAPLRFSVDVTNQRITYPGGYPLSYTLSQNGNYNTLNIAFPDENRITFNGISKRTHPFDFSTTKADGGGDNPDPNISLDPALFGEWQIAGAGVVWDEWAWEWAGFNFKNDGNVEYWSGYWYPDGSDDGVSVDNPDQTAKYEAKDGRIHFDRSIGGLSGAVNYSISGSGNTLHLGGLTYER